MRDLVNCMSMLPITGNTLFIIRKIRAMKSEINPAAINFDNGMGLENTLCAIRAVIYMKTIKNKENSSTPRGAIPITVPKGSQARKQTNANNPHAFRSFAFSLKQLMQLFKKGVKNNNTR